MSEKLSSLRRLVGPGRCLETLVDDEIVTENNKLAGFTQ